VVDEQRGKKVWSIVGRAPGELAADPNWAADLKQIMDELDIGDAESLDSLDALAAKSGSDAVSGTEQLARTLRQALEARHRETQAQPRLNSSFPEKRHGSPACARRPRGSGIVARLPNP
jgi:hypothetical protein